MKKAGILLKTGFVAIAALAISSAAYSQGSTSKSGNGNEVNQPQVVAEKSPNNPNASNSNTLKGGMISPEQSKAAHQQESELRSIATSNPEKNCASKSTMNPYSISRESFNNLPKDRQQFVLNNSDKYTIVD